MTTDLTNRLFEWIVEDPFFSNIHKEMVRVDDESNMYWYLSERTSVIAYEGLSDGMIEVLYREWYNYQVSNGGDDFINNCSAPHPSTI